jgi:hypothetical protein
MKHPDTTEKRGHNLFQLEEGASKQLYLQDYLTVALVEDFPLHTICTSFHKSVFQKVGYFRVGESFGEDADIFLRGLLQFSMAYCNKVTASYYLNTDNSLCVYHDQTHNVKNASMLTLKFELERQRIKDSRIVDLLEEYLLLLAIDYSKGLANGKYRRKAVTVLREIKTTKGNFWRKARAYTYIILPEKIKRIWYYFRGLFDWGARNV